MSHVGINFHLGAQMYKNQYTHSSIVRNRMLVKSASKCYLLLDM